ncbi:MAG: DNA translocase FtsK 4TM domain-containing protein [Collinsella sp.]
MTAAVAGFYHLGFGLGAYVLPIVILLFAATLFLGEDSPLNVRSVAGGAVVFIAVVSILSLMVPGTSDSCDLMFTPQNLSASGGYIGAFIASALQNALGKPIAMVVLLGLVVVGLVIIGFSVGGVLRSAHAIARPILPSAVVPMSTRARGVTKRPCRCPASPVRT